MSITTKKGDSGTTGLLGTRSVLKSDERIDLLGVMDELSSYLGLVKSQTKFPEVKELLGEIQNNMIGIMAGVAGSRDNKNKLPAAAVAHLEEAMEMMQQRFTMPEGWILPGGSTASAQVDVARTVARRCERKLAAVKVRYGADKMVEQYLNRLSDYLFILARYTDAAECKCTQNNGSDKMSNIDDIVMREVLKHIGKPGRITLGMAKKLIDQVEEYARQQGKQAVIAVVGPDGNPIAVHVMDDAYLVSFDVAVKKAYSAAAVKMSTMELGKVAQPGEVFQGLDQIEQDKLVFFGGGVPLMVDGKLVGALGVSGGTGEEDHDIAEYGLKVFDSL